MWLLTQTSGLDLKTTTTSQKCEAVPRRARSQGSHTSDSLNSRLESNEEEEEDIKTKMQVILNTHRFGHGRVPQEARRPAQVRCHLPRYVVRSRARHALRLEKVRSRGITSSRPSSSSANLQGYLAHKKPPPPLGPP